MSNNNATPKLQLVVKVIFETHGNESGWIAYADPNMGIVAHGADKSDAWKEFVTSLKVAIAHASGISGRELRQLEYPSPAKEVRSAEEVYRANLGYDLTDEEWHSFRKSEYGVKWLPKTFEAMEAYAAQYKGVPANPTALEQMDKGEQQDVWLDAWSDAQVLGKMDFIRQQMKEYNLSKKDNDGNKQ